MRRLILLAVLAWPLLCGAGPTLPGKPDPADALKAAPEWLAEPSPDDMEKAYPATALKQGVSGHTELSCDLDPEGRLVRCALVKETPEGMGFGAASLSLSDRFRMKPEATKAHLADGGKVLVPIRWAIVVHPEWLRLPSVSDLDGEYPRAAKERGINGRAVILCRVKSDGSLEDCAVIAETPIGYGFGQATIHVSHFFRMKPMQIDGARVDGALVQIPLNWQLGPGSTNVVSGEVGVMLTPLDPGAAPPKGAPTVNCPTKDGKARTCVIHGVNWRESPRATVLTDILKRNNLSAGESRLACTVGKDGDLTNCAIIGAATAQQVAGMRELAAHLKASPKTHDGIPTESGWIIVQFNWKELSTEVDRANR
jgi:TonB family protein